MTVKSAWRPLLTWLGVAGLIAFQAWAYLERLTLSLGPRVILQPWLMRNGFVPYENIVDQHMPLMPLLLTPLKFILPDGLQAAAVALVALISLTTLLTYLAARQVAGRPAGLIAALFFVAWSPVFGFGKLWHETFLAPLYAIFLLAYDPSARRRPPWKWLALGMLGGVAVLIKQHAAVVLAAFVAWTTFTAWQARSPRAVMLKQVGLMSLGAALPVLVYAVYQFARVGSLRSAAYWTIVFNLTSDYGTLAAQQASASQIKTVAYSALLLPAAIVCLVHLARKANPLWRSVAWGLVLLAAGSLTAYPRFAFFHLQGALPVLAWLSVVPPAIVLKPGARARWLTAGALLVLAAVWLATAAPMYRPVLQAGPARKIWEYSDLVPLAAEIRRQVAPADSLYIFPDDEATANLYYLAGQPPPRLWVFTYPWYMLDWVDAKIASVLDADPPQWVISFPGRDQIEQTAPVTTAYIRDHYRRAARLDWAQGEAWLMERIR